MHWVVDSQVMTINPVVKLPSVPDCRSLIINVLSRWKVENIIILWLRWPYLYFLPDTNKPRVRFRRIKTSKKPILQVTNRWRWMKISTGDIGFRWSSKRNKIEKQRFGINLATMGASSPLIYIYVLKIIIIILFIVF